MKICGFAICGLKKSFACPPLYKTQFEILSFQTISQGIGSARLGIDSCAPEKVYKYELRSYFKYEG
jgi:hypothetical protein